MYGAEIYLWQAIVILRQFISSAYLSNYHHRVSDAGLSFYRTIGQGDTTYLRSDTLDKFHHNFSMSPKGRQILAVAVEQIKKEARPIVSEFLRDPSQLIRLPTDPELDYLTCIELLDEALPWYLKPELEPYFDQNDGDYGMDGMVNAVDN
ncbi:uncharacterized protein L3040_008171 [Drepanopeziza brunnea f. sp. 'multigermtubi']|uniref:uncharacterized protein n=1 Tax=Drepanopeziza brunnea f. sp. 'multigermtubi' TaxID=698441 RepID=UPI0023A205F4|nr:hypothetical protein L3040_008171 [Drepanopeziza brunnea f. sp. 'multigermtubi']